MTRTYARITALAGATIAALVLMLATGAARADAQVEAGAAVVDASWHVGASAGQYAGDCATDPIGDPETVGDEDLSKACAFGVDPADGTYDPTVHSYRREKSYGLQARLSTRAIVVREGGGAAAAIVKTDQYIPQDLLHRRASQILESSHEDDACGGITRHTLTMAATHDHSSPMYSSTSWGVWAFQDVFDVRFYNYLAERIARAAIDACQQMVPVRVGASVGSFDKTHRHSFGPAIADDGTPAGYLHSDQDHDMTVIRFDDISDPGNPKPLANLVNFSLHPEFLEGNNLISADFIGPMERMTDRATGAVTVWTQGSVGTSEPERSAFHSIHERLEFTHKDYAQAEFAASLMARMLVGIWRDVERGTPDDPSRFVAFSSDFEVAVTDRWYPGPFSHPYPGVSNCRSDQTLGHDAGIPIVGLPDCERIGVGLQDLSDALGLPEPPPEEDPADDPGLDTDDFQALGIPVPENYSAPAYTGLEEDMDVHLQGIKLGEIYLPICSCEQWADQSRNIETRTNRTVGDEYLGYDWGAQCTDNGDGTRSCPNPEAPDNAGARLTVTEHEYERMRAQVNEPANGWNNVENAPYAESEDPDLGDPEDPNDDRFWGNYTHDDDEASAARGYTLTVPISMANDYNGYIATYREYQRGDHYRKALTGWGPHASDYMATRLVTIGRQLNGMPDSALPQDQKDERLVAAAKMVENQQLNDARAQALGTAGTAAIAAYEAGLPDDGGSAGPVQQPDDVERFDASFFTWNGGSNYTDDPRVRVEREVEPGVWREWADQSGELPVTLEFPAGTESVPGYVSGEHEWHWTAHFEAFVAPFNLGRPERATPAGSYRFVVDGERREGGARVPYNVVSEPFEVEPWKGITVEDLRADPEGQVSFRVGPRHTVQAAEGVSDEIGPIDYPDSYDDPRKAPFVREQRSAILDPADPTNPNAIEWFCFTCSFRPWLDAANAEAAHFIFQDRATGARVRVPARQRAGRWHAARPLRAGEAAFVPAAGVHDRYGNVNGGRSAIVRRGGGPGPPAEQTKLRAGAASADITPPIGTPMFAYTSRSQIADPPQSEDDLMQLIADPAPDENLYAKSFEPSEGIHTRLRASAIVVEREDEKFALVQADLGGVPYGLVQEVQARIAATGIPAENLMLSATHTHAGSGPIWPLDSSGYSALGGDFFDPRIFDLTAQGIADAIIDAEGELEPARVGVGSTELFGASRNRNIDPYKLNDDVDPSVSSDRAIDSRLTVIRVDAADGSPIGAWSNFAIHGTSFGDGNLLFSGDNMATTERVAEEEIARDGGLPVKPGAPGGDGPVLVWSNAAEGDVSPNGGPPNVDGEPLNYVQSSQANADMAGRKVAEGVLEAWRDAGGRMRGDMKLDARRTIVPIDGATVEGAPTEPVGPLAALGYGGIVGEDGECSPIPGVNGAIPGQGNKFPIAAGVGLVPQTVSLSLWRVDRTAIASFPFEVTTQMGNRISGAVEGAAGGEVDSAIIAGLTNGYLSYTATPEEYQACHYEGSFTLFGHQQGPWLRDGAVGMAPSLFDGGEPPSGVPEPPVLGIGTPSTPPIFSTPDAGSVVQQPEQSARRYGRASFSWHGGDPAVDAPRGETLVALQRQTSDDGWLTVGTEDGPDDVTVWDDEAETWTETWQFSECDPLGTYRFHVTGRAVKADGGDVEDYVVNSEPIELGAMQPLEIIDAAVSDGTARVRARYPDPGEALLAVPRRVRTGSATVTLAGGGEQVVATPDDEGLAFEAAVPGGSSIASVAVEDGCGNLTG